MSTLLQDVRYALRMLRNSPGYALVAVLTLALGIGSASVIFTVLNSVILRPLPYPDADRLVVVWEKSAKTSDENLVGPPNFEDWREQSQDFSGLSAMLDRPVNLTGVGDPAEVQVQLVSANFFSMLGASATVGRTLRPGEEGPTAEHVAVLSHRFWQSRFGGDPGAVGKTMTMNGRSYTVVGVMPASFRAPMGSPEVWMPFPLQTRDRVNVGRLLHVVGKLKPGVTVERARSDMGAIAGRLAQQFPDYNNGWGVNVVPLQEQVVGKVRPALIVLFGAVALLLLIACGNLANLLLGKALTRDREIAVRLALGATRGRLVRQLLTESVLLSVLGGLVGIGVAVFALKSVVASIPQGVEIPRLDEIHVDARVLAFSVAVTLVTGMLFGLVPALGASNPNLQEALKEGGRAVSASRGRRRVRSALLVSEVALALALLVGAGLMVRSFWYLSSVDLGFRSDGVLAMRLFLSPKDYPQPEQRTAFFNDLFERVKAMPGVQSVGSSAVLPLEGDESTTSFAVEGRPAIAAGEKPVASIRIVDRDFFRALGVPLRSGRTFAETDNATAPNVFVINEAMAKAQFAGENPIGKRITYDWTSALTGEVVGVVGNVRHTGITTDPEPAIYVPFQQMPSNGMWVMIHTSGDPTTLAQPVTAAVHAINPLQPVAEMRPLSSVPAAALARPRLVMLLLTGFAAAALFLAALGIYGTISYSVAQRAREMGIRMALGARGRDVVALVVREGMVMVAGGLAAGVVVALAGSRVMRGILAGVGATDAVTYAAVSGFLVLIALLACWIPARRAGGVDPIVSLKND